MFLQCFTFFSNPALDTHVHFFLIEQFNFFCLQNHAVLSCKEGFEFVQKNLIFVCLHFTVRTHLLHGPDEHEDH